MSAGLRRLVLLGGLLMLPTCAVVSKHLPGSGTCKRIAETEVPWDEERDLGGALALSLAARSGGFLVAPVPPAPLDGGAAGGALAVADAGSPARPDTSPADQLTLAVAEVGHQVARVSPRPVLVTTGLLATVKNESQQAGVLAHEVAHLTKRHALHVYRTSKSYQCYADIGRANMIGTVNIRAGATGASAGPRPGLGAADWARGGPGARRPRRW